MTTLDQLLTHFEEASIALHTEQTRSAQDRWHAAGDAIRAEFERGGAQATEGWQREWGVAADAGVYVYPTEQAAREAVRDSPAPRPVVSRLVGPWEPAEPEHGFDPSSVRSTPYSMFEEGDEPQCLCGAAWDLDADGCATQQPGWTPPPPYDGPTLEELLPAPAEQDEPARCSKCSGPLTPCVTCGKPAQCGEALCVACTPDEPAAGGVVDPAPAHEAEPAPRCPHCGAKGEQDQVDITTFTDMARGEIRSVPGALRCPTPGCPNGPGPRLTVYPNVPAQEAEPLATGAPIDPAVRYNLGGTLGDCPRCGKAITGFHSEPHDEDWSRGYRETITVATRYEPCGCTYIQAVGKPEDGGR